MDLCTVIISLTVFLCLLFHESMSMYTRIVGGSKIDITVVPFMLSLRLNGAHICGATIISKNWGLTAAHCVTTSGMDNQCYSVRSGSSFKDKGGRIQNVTSIISHELYNDVNTDYDIAVFKVKRPFRRSRTTRAIDLPGNDYVYDEWATIAGWGYYMVSDYYLAPDSHFHQFDVPPGRGNVLSEQLRYVMVPKMERMRCAADYSGRYELTPRQVCYGYEQGGKDSCQGDSGGPLFTNSNIIIGITSWGEDCGAVNSPGVYTTIFFMLNWIYEKTGVKSRL